jgi:hypothetical protein
MQEKLFNCMHLKCIVAKRISKKYNQEKKNAVCKEGIGAYKRSWDDALFIVFFQLWLLCLMFLSVFLIWESDP